MERGHDLPTKRVLIVDDERLTRVSLADFLQDMGYETAVASDGESAAQLQQERPFDVCIVDIRMPTMGGVEVILTLHRIASSSRFIVYTGSPQFMLPPALEEIGLMECDIVRKPVLDMEVFAALIEARVAS
jgi:DNA-binding NtrC family response regulator